MSIQMLNRAALFGAVVVLGSITLAGCKAEEEKQPTAPANGTGTPAAVPGRPATKPTTTTVSPGGTTKPVMPPLPIMPADDERPRLPTMERAPGTRPTTGPSFPMLTPTTGSTTRPAFPSLPEFNK